MNKNLTSYLLPKLDKFLNNESNFRRYIIDNFKATDFKSFEDYLKNTSNENYELYSEILLKYHKGFESGFSKSDGTCITDMSVHEFSVDSLSKFIFSDKNLSLCLKKYVSQNPLSVLVYSDYFLSLIGNFISPHIQNNPGAIFVDNDENVSFFLNSVSQRNYITLNLSFLRICINSLLSMYTGDSCEFYVTIKNNKMTFSYGNSEYHCILVNKSDMDAIFNSFGYSNNKEKLQAVNIFYNKDVPYDFFIFYFSRIHRYTSERYSIFQMWVVERYESIMKIPYFKRIADEYSVGISVLMHSICPYEDTYEYIEKMNSSVNHKNKDSFAFSLALWLYNKRGYYYENNLKK